MTVRVVGILFALSWLFAARSSAGEGIVITSRSRDLSELEREQLADIRARLSIAGFDTPLEATSSPTVSVEAVAPLLKEGIAAYYDSSFDRAAAVLDKAVRLLEGAPTVAEEIEELRSRRLQALTALAVIHDKAGRADKARIHFDAIAREYPDIDRDARNKLRLENETQFGQAVAKRRAESAAELAKRQPARLEITARGGGDLYVDLRPVGRDFAVVSVPAGTYRVFGKRGDAIGNVKEVRLASGDSLKIEIDVRVELARRSAPTLELSFEATEEQAAREVEIASTLAGEFKARRAVVLSVRDATAEGEAWIVGNVVTAGGDLLTRASLGAAPGGDSLALFVAILAGQAGALSSLGAGPLASETIPLATWSLLGCGVGAIAGGATLLSSGIDDGGFKNQGRGLIAVGSACLAGFGGILLARHLQK